MNIEDDEKLIDYPTDIIKSDSMDILVYTYIAIHRSLLNEIQICPNQIREFYKISNSRNGRIIALRNSIDRIVRKVTTNARFKIDGMKPRDTVTLKVKPDELGNFKKEDPDKKGYHFTQITIPEFEAILNYKAILNDRGIKYETVRFDKILKFYLDYKIEKIRARKATPEYLKIKYTEYGNANGLSAVTVAKIVDILVKLDLIVIKRMATLKYTDPNDSSKYKLVTNYTLIVDKTEGWERVLEKAEKHFKKTHIQGYGSKIVSLHNNDEIEED